MVVKHVIVDGSNIATEGREAPSLAQLDEAVRSFVAEYGPEVVTVVVDATFPNRIDASERQTYEDAAVANELITPPAGAIGRGDGFVLQIADKAGAAILSNDSFQEFHGNYPWLFERGRLIGGKPVPQVGWVFMERAPVRGPTSRRAVSEARKEAKAAATASPPAAAGKAATKAAGKKASTRKSRAKGGAAGASAPETAGGPSTAEAPAPPSDGAAGGVASVAAGAPAGGPAAPPGGSYNEALTFIEFVGAHPVGSEVEATVERFSSHGAYAVVGEARGYVPLRYLADPAPRSAKEVLTVGETRRFVVVAIDPPRRGIDLGLPGVAEAVAPPPTAEAAAPEPEAAPARKRSSRKRTAEPQPGEEPSAEEAPARKRGSRKKAAEAPASEPEAAPARKRGSRKKAAAPEPEPPVDEAPVRMRGSRKKAAEPEPAGEPSAEEAPVRKRGSRKKAAAPEPSAEEAPVRKRASRRRAAAPEEAATMNGGPEPAPTRKRASRKKAATEPEAAPVPPGNSAENGSSSS